jgi:hypothetical protein
LTVTFGIILADRARPGLVCRGSNFPVIH